jgi:hypothetical protein
MRFLKSWSDHFVGNVHMQLAMAKEVVGRLEEAGDRRPLVDMKKPYAKNSSSRPWDSRRCSVLS